MDGTDINTGGDARGHALPSRQETFCQAYVADPKRVASRAAAAAGYSESTAKSQASRLLTNVAVRARIRELEREALAASGWETEHIRAAVMREYVRIAFSDITDVVHVSPGEGDPERQKALDALAMMSGGQRALDFGETLVMPTTALTSEATAAIKSIKCCYGRAGDFQGFEVNMHDKLNALRVLAEASGLIRNSLAVTGEDGGPVAICWANGGNASGEARDDA
jgi:phage terminase small subunit